MWQNEQNNMKSMRVEGYTCRDEFFSVGMNPRRIFLPVPTLEDDSMYLANNLVLLNMYHKYVTEMRPPSRKGQPVIVEFSIYVVDVNSINVEDMDFSSMNLRIILQDLQYHKYITEMRPPSRKGQPVIVEFSIYVVDVNSINVEDMDFRVDMFIRQTWSESRLQLPDDIFEEGDDHVTLPPEFFDNLWHPDPYFLNSKVTEIAELTHKFSSVTLYRNQTVRYAARMHAIIACQMEFQLYPMDIQSCPIYIESFSYSNQKVRFRWSEAGVTINPELKLLQYHIGEPLRLEETNGYMIDKDGNYSRLVVYFRFERQIGHHLIQTFAPSSLVVMLSWFSFWLDLDAIPGRVTLLVTCMLTLVTMFTGLRADIPPVAYVKALDLWMAGCMMFVFAALGEFVVVKVLDKQYQMNKSKAQESMPRIIPVRLNGEKGSCGTVAAWEGSGVRCRKIDLTSPTSPPATTPGVHTTPTAPTPQLVGVERRQSILQRLNGEKGSCGTVAAWEGSGVRCRKIDLTSPTSPPATTPGVHTTPTAPTPQLVGVERRQSILQVAWLDADTGQERVLWREIDKLSRVVFPALFLLFVTMYWPVLLLKTKSSS
ncbi:Glycine receptor subunit alpha-1 [Papilio machaon]|uniref:Glycine receptor subunit alpha-1 n=1 Tax=Papilio machaon TaxID=76193 RepID=A0A194QL15_PAPMA|nr:Glycine receptor subunit alpha-1 [Papilio machaon]